MSHAGSDAARGTTRCSCINYPDNGGAELFGGARLTQRPAANVLGQDEPHAGSRHVSCLITRRARAARCFRDCWVGFKTGFPHPAFIMSRIVAITGATGFLGRYIVRAFAGSGWRVRILARQPIDHLQLAGLQLEVVLGDLSNRQALRALVNEADVIVHAAGLIKARTPAAFEAVNVGGTANLAHAIEERGSIARVLLVSSMAAREPELSPYARTTRAAEQLLRPLLNRLRQLTIVQACAICGPLDRETLTIFRAVQYHIFLRPRIAHGRIAVIHAVDAAAAIAV